MKKLFLFFVLMSTVALGYTQNRNVATGATNFYENLYGHTFASSTRGAMDALVFIDFTFEDDYVEPALEAEGYNVTVATDWADFDAKLASGDYSNYSLAVAFVQGDFDHPSLAGLQSFLTHGGRIIYDDWNLDANYGNFFEAGFTGNINFDIMEITDAGVLAGLSNPIYINDPGWNFVFSYGMTATGSGEYLAYFEELMRVNNPDEQSIIRGNGGQTIILGYMSDTPQLNGSTRANDRQQLFQNVINSLAPYSPPPATVPVSPWALIFGVFLIAVFMVVRYKRNLA